MAKIGAAVNVVTMYLHADYGQSFGGFRGIVVFCHFEGGINGFGIGSLFVYLTNGFSKIVQKALVAFLFFHFWLDVVEAKHFCLLLQAVPGHC